MTSVHTCVLYQYVEVYACRCICKKFPLHWRIRRIPLPPAPLVDFDSSSTSSSSSRARDNDKSAGASSNKLEALDRACEGFGFRFISNFNFCSALPFAFAFYEIKNLN